MTTDEQEAESRKYGAVAMVLRLESGNFAIFGPNRKLYNILPDTELMNLFTWDSLWVWCQEQNREVFKPARSPAINLDDIGEIEI